MTVLIVGQRASRAAKPTERALTESDSWKRLAGIIGEMPEQLARQCDTINILPVFLGKSPGGKYDRAVGQRDSKVLGEATREFCYSTINPSLVVCLGRWTSVAWGHHPTLPYGVSYTSPREFTEVVVPHPGGSNMRLNDKVMREHMGGVLRKLLVQHSVESDNYGTRDLESREWRTSLLQRLIAASSARQ